MTRYPMSPRNLEDAIRMTLDEPEATVHDMTENGGWGLVRWSRPRDYIAGGREHIVHRCAITYTDGNDRPFMLYSGGYYDEEEFARSNYREREDRPPERNQPPLARLVDEGKVTD